MIESYALCNGHPIFVVRCDGCGAGTPGLVSPEKAREWAVRLGYSDLAGRGAFLRGRRVADLCSRCFGVYEEGAKDGLQRRS